MKVFWIVILAIMTSLISEKSYSQNTFTLSLRAKGTFEFDANYPKGEGGKWLFNFHGMVRKPSVGERVNYFIFEPSEDVFKAMYSMSRTSLFSRLEPCSGGLFGLFKHRYENVQAVGGSLEAISGKESLFPYVKEYNFFKNGKYIYVAINEDLEVYVRKDNWHEWIYEAFKRKEICLHIGVGQMALGWGWGWGFGWKALASRPVNITRLGEFVISEKE